MAGLYKKYSEQGLHIIGLECQNSSAAEISGMAKSSGVEYQMTTGGDLKGTNVRGIPHGFLFGADGKLAADDPPGNQLETKIKALLKETSAFMAGPGPYKKLAALAAQVKGGQGLGTVLKTLASKKDSKDAEEAKEAQIMFEALSGAAQGMLDGALAQKDEDPVASLAKLDKLAAQFSGHELGTKAKQESDNLKKDPKVRKEIEADTVWKQISAAKDGLKPVRGAKDPADPSFRKINAGAIQGIVAGCQGIVQRYPGTAASKKAEELMNDFR